MKAPRQARAEFGTSYGQLVYYQLVCWECIHDPRGVVQPLASEARAAWAVKVLTNHYGGRVYETVKRYMPPGAAIEQVEVFADWVLDDLFRLELADKQGQE
ncbi:hypothetical protein [Pseudomonas paraeruginosa]|uniref:hypothetical protein n=1 Tax=Pseudomonas paraeruginosa TaxID=2994495 RepID=UPI00053E9A4A|nr:hypothetical protein [Pseudomonas paraeruginosa]